jgi:hypothetical protein
MTEQQCASILSNTLEVALRSKGWKADKAFVDQLCARFHDPRRFAEVCTQLSDTLRFPPTLADFVALLQQPTGAGLLAFNQALKARHTYGPSVSISFEDRLTLAVLADMALSGDTPHHPWEHWCSLDLSEEYGRSRLLREEFLDRYEHYQKHPPAHLPSHFAGYDERLLQDPGFAEFLATQGEEGLYRRHVLEQNSAILRVPREGPLPRFRRALPELPVTERARELGQRAKQLYECAGGGEAGALALARRVSR